MVLKPFKVKSSSSEHFERLRWETNVGDLRIIAGGELFATRYIKNCSKMFTNYFFWISICVCLLGYFIFRFGMLSQGNKKNEIEFSGGLILLGSFILIFFSVGWKALLVQIGVFWVVITPIIEIIVSSIQKKIHS